MKTIYPLENTIQEYAWGSTSALSNLTGKPNKENKPQAELWMGAHPKAPSKALCDGQWFSLMELIEKYPEEMLGNKTATLFGRQLPFLFKVLAAGKPLSIQAHPSPQQAREGFERENRLNIPMDAYNRNYKDESHKPECICALSPFWALNGFRPIAGILNYFKALCPHLLTQERRILKTKPDPQGLREFFKALLTLSPGQIKDVIEMAVKHAKELRDRDPVYEWILKLYEEYHLDVGVLSPAVLNLVCLKPGQAMYLPAGRLHAYLEGLGIELMANSDNVLRGGCTPKHMDVPELLKVVDFGSNDVGILTPTHGTSGSESEGFYFTPAAEFVLSVITVSQNISHDSALERSLEILFCTRGRAKIDQFIDNHTLLISKGESVVIPAAAIPYRIEGNAVFYKASVPLKPD
ncbi:MAG: mannose-6-phosphate isomerase, class I [Proteobacteria bacterium]|nr:mannose-6-phosphate isomerase, class I [Pseudomonadota bacterium]